MHMTHLEKGCYLDLLMLQFNRGKFTEAQAKHMLQSSFDLVWSTIQEKFICENGLYWNQRLATEKEKRSKFTESRRNNATKEKEDKPSEKHMLQHTHNRMEDENINENKDLNGIEIKEENKKFQKPNHSEISQFILQKYPDGDFQGSINFAEKFFDFYENKDWKIGKAKMKNWKLAISSWSETLQKDLFPTLQNQLKTKQQDFQDSKVGKLMQVSQEADELIRQMFKDKKENESANSN